MDSTIIAGGIGGIATIIAAIVSPIIANKRQEKRKASLMPAAPLPRQNSLYGKWAGEMDQKVGIERVLNKHNLHIQFNNDSVPITGKMRLEFKVTGDELLDEDRYIDAEIINTIYDGRILKCDYVNKDNNAIHFGTLYGELSSNGKEIYGEFLGFGLISEMFVSGKMYLKKKNNQ